MGRIAEPLRCMGATVLGRDGGRLPPLTIQGGSLQGLDYTLPVASAQVKSPLLLAGLYAGGATSLCVPGPARDHTERMLVAMGARLETEDWGLATGGQRLWLSRAIPCGHLISLCQGTFRRRPISWWQQVWCLAQKVLIEGAGVNPTRTGLLDVLRAMGADVVLEDERMVGGEPVADLAVRASDLAGTEVSGQLVVRTIDEFPILAVAATQARGETVVRDAAELRVKETDRIATTVQELRRLGAEIEAQPDGFVVQGPTPLQSPDFAEGQGSMVFSHGDHRLAMALVVAGLIARGETCVQDTDCIADSFPGFAAALAKLGGNV